MNKKTERGLQITTLGRFRVANEQEVISEKFRRARKLWNLFRYFLTNRGKLLTPYSITNTLWPDSQNAAPKAALQDLVYRLRLLLEDATPDSGEPLVRIDFAQEAYCFTLSSEVWLDADQFLQLSQEAKQTKGFDVSQAVELYTQAISLYSGSYLPSLHDRWVLPFRQHYRKTLIHNLHDVVGIFRASGDHSGVVEVCAGVFSEEHQWLLEAEQLHTHYMEALIRTGRLLEASNHYELLNELYDTELGVSPRVSLQQLKAKADKLTAVQKSVDMDGTSVSRVLLQSEEMDGAVICDPEEFRLIYQVQMRKREISQQGLALAFFTLNSPSFTMETFNEFLKNNLRSGDVVTRWNDTQCLALLPEFKSEYNEHLQQRILSAFCRERGAEQDMLRIQLWSPFND